MFLVEIWFLKIFWKESTLLHCSTPQHFNTPKQCPDFINLVSWCEGLCAIFAVCNFTANSCMRSWPLSCWNLTEYFLVCLRMFLEIGLSILLVTDILLIFFIEFLFKTYLSTIGHSFASMIYALMPLMCANRFGKNYPTSTHRTPHQLLSVSISANMCNTSP